MMMTDNICQNRIKLNLVNQLHQISAIIALILIPLPGWPTKIGLALLFLGLLRIPTTIKSVGELLRMPLFLLLLAWWLIAVISETWASHPTQSLLASPLLILIIPALRPVLVQPRPFILAIGLGAVIHTTIQAMIWFGIVPSIRYMPMTTSGGLHWYPPFTALWSTCTFLLLIGLILKAKSWKYRLVPLCIAVPLPVSLVLAGTRVLYIIIPFAIIFLMWKLLLVSSTRVEKIFALYVCIGICVIGIGSLLIPGTSTHRDISTLVKELSTSSGNLNAKNAESTPIQQSRQFVNSVGMRYLWWRAGLDIWKERPWIGHGNGSTKYQFAIMESKMPTKYGADVEGFLIADPHSSVLATAIEQGLLGVIPMVLFVLLAFVRAWKRAIANPPLVGLSACWLTMIGFSFVHTIQFSNYVATLVVILVSYTLCMTKVEKSIPKCSLTFPAE